MPGKVFPAAYRVIGGVLLTLLVTAVLWVQSSRSAGLPPTIALVPSSAGAMLWEVKHFGAAKAAESLKCHLYWNAPTSETDVAGQVSLIDRIARGGYRGLVLAPNHPFAILAPLRRAVAAGLPVVVVSAPLDIPATANLGYILNDDEKMGELAAAEIAKLMNGKGAIALAGLGRYAPGVKQRVLGAERFLATRFPGIRVVSRLSGAYNAARAEELTSNALAAHPEVSAVLSFTASSMRGVHAAVKNKSLLGTIRLVGCEQDSDLIAHLDSGEIDAIVAENTYRMGHEAVRTISASWTGTPIPPRTIVAPMLITKQNLDSADARLLTSFPK